MTTIILCSLDKPLYDAWNEHCGHLDMVETHLGDILDVQCDAVVSPANSFGFMDGGIDMVYSRHFGWDVQKRLQNSIRTNHHGELVVGAAEIVETGDLRAINIPYLIAAPTMRVPMILTNTVNPYLAARAALLLVKHGTYKKRKISQLVDRIAIPGLGTGVGEVTPNMCATQVRTAIEDALIKHEFPYSWDEASSRHQRLYRNHVADLQFEKD